MPPAAVAQAVREADLVIGESGKVEADISVGSISISGDVKGNINAKKRVEIHAPAVVQGNIQTPSLIVEEGVVFEGTCSMDKARAAQKDARSLKTAKANPEVRDKTGSQVLHA